LRKDKILVVEIPLNKHFCYIRFMILVTGGTGLVGSHLLYYLSLENETVRATHRKTSDLSVVKEVFSFYSNNFESLFNKIEWVEADITDVFSLEIAFENVTKVYHCAALVSFNENDYKAMRKINIEGTANIVNFCIKNEVEKLCYVSSIATISKSATSNVISESNEWDAEKSDYDYAITKYGAEMEVWRASQEGVPVVIVNPGVILGAGFFDSGSGEIFRKIYNGFKFYTEGVTGYISVNDVVKAMVVLMKSNIKNERYILVAENKTFKEVFFEIAENFDKKPPTIQATKTMTGFAWRFEKVISIITGKPPLLSKQSAKSIHSKCYYSSDKIKKALDYKFEPISKTIAEVCSLYNK